MRSRRPTCRRSRSVKRRREERELFFWSVREVLTLVRRAVITAYLVITLITGHIIGSAEVVDLVAKIGSLLN